MLPVLSLAGSTARCLAPYEVRSNPLARLRRTSRPANPPATKLTASLEKRLHITHRSRARADLTLSVHYRIVDYHPSAEPGTIGSALGQGVQDQRLGDARVRKIGSQGMNASRPNRRFSPVIIGLLATSTRDLRPACVRPQSGTHPRSDRRVRHRRSSRRFVTRPASSLSSLGRSPSPTARRLKNPSVQAPSPPGRSETSSPGGTLRSSTPPASGE